MQLWNKAPFKVSLLGNWEIGRFLSGCLHCEQMAPGALEHSCSRFWIIKLTQGLANLQKELGTSQRENTYNDHFSKLLAQKGEENIFNRKLSV